jgi:hypothetical protein
VSRLNNRLLLILLNDFAVGGRSAKNFAHLEATIASVVPKPGACNPLILNG